MGSNKLVKYFGRNIMNLILFLNTISILYITRFAFKILLKPQTTA